MNGTYGFSMPFFRTCWIIIKTDFMSVFQVFHSRGKFERSPNATFIALIPKKLDAVEMKDCCHISELGGVYR